ncbi:MAG: hypothetical protein NXI23_15805 [Bacteroidetes bacterium]|jgi:hypothetical protein|nr:hypothetical protein [Bacteroidota bacterium]MDF1867154.1 hypothetical protein [Saprospiraceae bacterium]
MALRPSKPNPIQVLLKEIPAPLQNRYFLILILFFAWMVFFDKHDLMTQWQLSGSVERLEFDKVYYEDQIKSVRKDLLNLELNQEKFAREKYYMQKSNEDVFIIVNKEE